jgi:hypothetical protein
MIFDCATFWHSENHPNQESKAVPPKYCKDYWHCAGTMTWECTGYAKERVVNPIVMSPSKTPCLLTFQVQALVRRFYHLILLRQVDPKLKAARFGLARFLHGHFSMDNCEITLSISIIWELYHVWDTYFRVSVIEGGYYYGSFGTEKSIERHILCMLRSMLYLCATRWSFPASYPICMTGPPYRCLPDSLRPLPLSRYLAVSFHKR